MKFAKILKASIILLAIAQAVNLLKMSRTQRTAKGFKWPTNPFAAECGVGSTSVTYEYMDETGTHKATNIHEGLKSSCLSQIDNKIYFYFVGNFPEVDDKMKKRFCFFDKVITNDDAHNKQVEEKAANKIMVKSFIDSKVLTHCSLYEYPVDPLDLTHRHPYFSQDPDPKKKYYFLVVDPRDQIEKYASAHYTSWGSTYIRLSNADKGSKPTRLYTFSKIIGGGGLDTFYKEGFNTKKEVAALKDIKKIEKSKK